MVIIMMQKHSLFGGKLTHFVCEFHRVVEKSVGEEVPPILPGHLFRYVRKASHV